MIINELSKFLTGLKYEDIPKEAIDKAKICFLDYLAVYNKGLKTENSQIAIDTISALFSNDFNLLNKGFIYGIASHSLDLDDGHRLAQIHPGAIVFSTILAIVCDEQLDFEISTKKFFESIICGYEVSILLGMLVNPEHRNQGFHTTGTIGTLAAGATASKLLDLDLNQIINCLGLCTTQSSGLLESDHAGTMGKSLHVGKAVYNGLLSAFLAKNGFSGGESIIDGKEGFITAMVTKSKFNKSFNNNLDKDSIKKFLDENFYKFHINEVYIKKFPFCRHIHSAIDSTLILKHYIEESPKDINAIDSIQIETYKIASEHNNFSPINSQELKQSLPYAVAIALVCDDLNLDTIEELLEHGLLNDLDDNFISVDNQSITIKNIKNIVDKISISYSKPLDILTPNERPAKVIIKFSDYFQGETIDHTTFYPLGESENPLSKEDVLDKFQGLNPNFNLNNLKIIEDMEFFSLKYTFQKIGII